MSGNGDAALAGVPTAGFSLTLSRGKRWFLLAVACSTLSFGVFGGYYTLEISEANFGRMFGIPGLRDRIFDAGRAETFGRGDHKASWTRLAACSAKARRSYKNRDCLLAHFRRAYSDFLMRHWVGSRGLHWNLARYAKAFLPLDSEFSGPQRFLCTLSPTIALI